MEMKINKNLIKAKRLEKAWSQQHLAEVAGLSLRTVQRVENSGEGSLDTVKAFGAALDVNPQAMQESRQPKSALTAWWQKIGLSSAAAVVALVALVGYVSLVQAESVMLDLSIDSNQFAMKNLQLVDELGNAVEVRIDKQFRMVFTPKLTEDHQIHVSVDVYRYKDGQELLVSTPRIITADNTPANILFALENEAFIDIGITPKL